MEVPDAVRTGGDLGQGVDERHHLVAGLPFEALGLGGHRVEHPRLHVPEGSPRGGPTVPTLRDALAEGARAITDVPRSGRPGPVEPADVVALDGAGLAAHGPPEAADPHHAGGAIVLVEPFAAGATTLRLIVISPTKRATKPGRGLSQRRAGIAWKAISAGRAPSWETAATSMSCRAEKRDEDTLAGKGVAGPRPPRFAAEMGCAPHLDRVLGAGSAIDRPRPRSLALPTQRQPLGDHR